MFECSDYCISRVRISRKELYSLSNMVQIMKSVVYFYKVSLFWQRRSCPDRRELVLNTANFRSLAINSPF